MLRDKEAGPRKSPQHSELLKRLADVQQAARVIQENLPLLIRAALQIVAPEGGINFNPDLRQDQIDKLQAQMNQARTALEIEENLLGCCEKFLEREGFYGGTSRREMREPWASQAGFYFALISSAIEKAEGSAPAAKAASENTPLVKVIQEALSWMGYGHRELATIAQSIKRGAKDPKKLSADQVMRRAIAYHVLMGTWDE
jgi:hypothetical protein